MKKYWILIIIVVLLFSQCSPRVKEDLSVQGNVDEDNIVQIDSLEPLEAGEIVYKGDEPFRGIIELKGRHITGDTAILKSGDLLIKNKTLVLSPGIFDPISILKLPEVRNVLSIGSIGQGPEEFLRPLLISTQDTGTICYVTDKAKYSKLFRLTNDYKLELIPSPLRKEMSYMLDNIHHIEKNEYMYVRSNGAGKDIVRTQMEGDSIVSSVVYDLNLEGKPKDWAAHIGCFGVNVKANRMVYAYKYYRKIKFMDLEAKTIRTITFKNEKELDDSTLKLADGLDMNVTYYFRICAQNKSVYILLLGRKPVDVYHENMKENYYMYIEQYDWNGNPMRKYKLDMVGDFVVDEANKKLYMTSSLFDESFFEFDLPE